jgi:molecular chaperone DnaJ
MQSTAVCPQCGGQGKVIKAPCTTCRGKGKVRHNQKIRVKVPAGVDAGQSVRVRNEGSVGVNGGPNGDVLAEIYIKRHAVFQRNGMDVFCEVPISFTQAALGAEIQVPTLDGWVKYDIPEGTQTGKEFILSEKGIPDVGNPRRRGRHRFTVVVETPTKLTREQRELLQKLDETMDNKSTPKRKKFFDTLKDLFD